MHPAPRCTGLGSQCQQIPATLRIGSLAEGDGSLDHEATWLLGHTQQITFGGLHSNNSDLLVDAVLHVRCRHLKRMADGQARCGAHGFGGPMPERTAGARQPRRLGGNRFQVVTGHEWQTAELSFPPRSLPVMMDVNPCSIAPCATADHTRGSACCRDLQVEIMCARSDTRQEALVRSRLSPYLCKVIRESEDAIEAEMISACGYLDDPGENCTLHGRNRSDGRPAKPDLCSEWPDDGKGLHPGCIFYDPPGKKKRPVG